MRNSEINNLPITEGYTYVSGLGFIAPNDTQKIVRDIRHIGNAICFCLLLFFFCQRFLVLPATYFAYYLGFDININRYTGMIMATDFSKQMISFFTNMGAMLITMLTASFFCLRNFKLHYAFHRPHFGALPIAIPIILAVGILGEVAGMLFADVSHWFGIVFSKQYPLVLSNELLPNISGLLIILVFAALEEILFRGIILYSLRRYGDGFAIFTSAMLFAIFQDGIIEMVSAFFLGLALGYFVVRSGSIYTAIIGHCSLRGLLFMMAYLRVLLEPTLGNVVVTMTCLLVCVAAAFSFTTFVLRDKNAFVLKKPDGNLSLRRRLISFCATVGFFALVFTIAMRIINRIQIIG